MMIVLILLSILVAPPCLRWPQQHTTAAAVELTLDASMVRNIKVANETATTLSSTDYVDLTCKVGERRPWELLCASHTGSCRNVGTFIHVFGDNISLLGRPSADAVQRHRHAK